MKIIQLIAAFLTLFASVFPERAAAQELGLPPVTTEWTPPLILDDEEILEVLNVSVDSDASGNIIALWVGRVVNAEQTAQYRTTYFARSMDAGESWSEAKSFYPLRMRTSYWIGGE